MALQTSPAFSALLDIIKWAKKPLQYSLQRVNTLRISPKEALEKVRVDLATQAANLGRPTPTAQLHPRIPDAITISAWPGLKPLLEPPPDRPEYPAVIVDSSSAHAVIRGARVYNGGVLAISENASVGDTVSVYAFHDGIRSWIAYGKLCSMPLTSKEFETRRPHSEGCIVEITEGMSVVPTLCQEILREGLLHSQSLPSILVPHILSPQAGERVLVLGNDRGHMTSHVAALTSNKADIVAVTHSNFSSCTLRHRCEFAGAKVSQVYSSVEDFISNETVKFDCAIVNPIHSNYGGRPCIEGLFFNGREVNTNARSLAETALKLLKPGGRLVYYTHSAVPLESVAVLRWLLDHSNVKLVTAEPRVAPVGVRHCLPHPSWMKLSAEEEKLIQQFGPHVDELESDPITVDAPSGFIACLTVTH